MKPTNGRGGSAAGPSWTPRSEDLSAQQYPDIADLMSRLHFSPREGRIWLDDQRMQLIHTSAMGLLRRELIENLGTTRARGLLTRMGYNSGAHDAHLAKRLRLGSSLQDMFYVGPQLHALEGVVYVEPVVLDIDVERGHLYGEFIWRGSSEDEEHVRTYGIGSEPNCWMQIGYASGYTSVFMGRPVLFREVECASMGHTHCRIIGKPVEAWDDAEEDLAYLRAESFTQGLSASAIEAAGGENASIFSSGGVVGISTGFNSVCHMVQRVADTSATVLFLGESGVGKEVFARALHRIGPRADKPFVAVNCAAIPEALVESELFGVERGAFTGAHQARPGRFERADGGTLFLDEIGILSMPAQGKLLRALQESEIERVGGTQTRRVDVRLVAATNLDLREEVKAGRFREDLFFRLNVFPVRVPPLRERRQDIPVFMNHFLQKYSRRHGRTVTGFTGRAIEALLNYAWPGNVRELENMIERGVILAPAGGAIDSSHLFTGGEKLDPGSFELRRDGRVCAGDGSPVERPASEAERVRRKVGSLLGDAAECSEGGADDVSLEEIETALLKSAVRVAEGNLAAAARRLGITRPQLVYRLKSRGLLGAEH